MRARLEAMGLRGLLALGGLPSPAGAAMAPAR